MKISTLFESEKSLPTSYRRFSKALDSGRAMIEFEFRGARPQIFRFANRYRFASAFRSIELTGYQEPTIRAYSALLRVLLTCSAAEQYSKITDGAYNLDSLDKIIPLEDRVRCLNSTALADPNQTFFKAVCERTRSQPLVSAVQASLNGESSLIMPLIKSVRHAFAHGDLAPGANGARPGVAQKFAKAVCPVLLGAINADFTRRVDRVLDRYEID